MAVFTPINQEELLTFLEQYDIGELIDFEGILEGIENSNFKIFTKDNIYILTIFEKRVNPKDLPFFIDLQSHLSEKKFFCPIPIKNKKGESINLLKGKSTILISYLIGKKTPIVSIKNCKQVGEVLSLLHAKTIDFNQKRKNTMNLIQLKNIFSKCNRLEFNKFKNIMPHINKELIFLEKEWPKDLPNGIIHGDVFQDNVFFNNNNFTGLIDFYFSCNDFLAYDIAITINAWCFDNNYNFNKNKFISLIEGYENLRKLTNDELDKLSILLRGAALRILITRLHDQLFHPEGAFVEPKNPNEYISILKFHQQHNISEYIK